MGSRPSRALLAWLILIVASLGGPGAKAQGQNQVGLVVQFTDGSYLTRCIQFSEPQISGYDVLLRSGLALEISVQGGMGAFVCSIEGVGCPATDCMCDYPPNYWSYWHLVNGQWVYSQMGATGYMVGPGNVEGWSWGPGNPPLAIPLAQICLPPATDTPTPTATWTPSPTASATSTPTPSRTPRASATWTPTLAHTPTSIPPTATRTPTVPPWPTSTAVVQPTSPDTPQATATKAGPTPPAPTSTATSAPAPAPALSTATETYEPTATATTPVLGTPLPPASFPTPAATTTSTSLPSATATATWEGGVTPPAAPEQPAPSQQDQPAAVQKTENLLTWLSVGAGAAYLSFVAFLIFLGGLVVWVKIKQR